MEIKRNKRNKKSRKYSTSKKTRRTRRKNTPLSKIGGMTDEEIERRETNKQINRENADKVVTLINEIIQAAEQNKKIYNNKDMQAPIQEAIKMLNLRYTDAYHYNVDKDKLEDSIIKRTNEQRQSNEEYINKIKTNDKDLAELLNDLSDAGIKYNMNLYAYDTGSSWKDDEILNILANLTWTFKFDTPNRKFGRSIVDRASTFKENVKKGVKRWWDGIGYTPPREYPNYGASVI